MILYFGIKFQILIKDCYRLNRKRQREAWNDLILPKFRSTLKSFIYRSSCPTGCHTFLCNYWKRLEHLILKMSSFKTEMKMDIFIFFWSFYTLSFSVLTGSYYSSIFFFFLLYLRICQYIHCKFLFLTNL